MSIFSPFYISTEAAIVCMLCNLDKVQGDGQRQEKVLNILQVGLFSFSGSKDNGLVLVFSTLGNLNGSYLSPVFICT